MEEFYEDYIKEKQVIDIYEANKFGIRLLLILTLASFLAFYLYWPDTFFIKLGNLFAVNGIWNLLVGFVKVIAIVVMGIVFHELIHGLFWAVFAKKGFQSVKLGILRKYLTPYCHSKEPLKVWQYILGAIMPALFLGFLPLILSIIHGSLPWLIFGVFFIAAAGGDFIMINMLLKEKMTDWVQDHPSEAGFYMFRKKD